MYVHAALKLTGVYNQDVFVSDYRRLLLYLLLKVRALERDLDLGVLEEGIP